jgi:hypothetical protein
VQELTESIVATAEEALQFFRTGEEKRKYGGTDLNERSSRSHVVFRVYVEMRDAAKLERQLYSTLNLIDLAGSENV